MLRFVCALILGLTANFAIAKVESEFIFPAGSTSFASSHASTIVELKNSELMAAWFGGTDEGKPDVAIWASRRNARGWSAPSELAREPNIACWNPVLFHTHDGRLWLYYKFGPNPAEWTGARKFSDDEGITWSKTEHLPAGLLGPIRAKPLVLADGTIISGSSVESYHSWAAWIERSTDNGKTWTKFGPLVPEYKNTSNPDPDPWGHFGIIQPSVICLGKGHLRFYARSTEQLARVCISDSLDDGRTWSQPHPIDVPNPNSGIDAVALKDGRVVLVYNNTSHGRSPLNLAVSNDGEHFRMFSTLESEPGEFSYPAMIQTADCSLEITYTWNRKTIRHTHVPLSDVPR